MEERLPSKPVGYLLSKFGLLAILAGLLLAAWNGQLIIVILLGLLVSAAGLAKFWSRLSLANVTCQRLLSERRAFPGESIELTLRVVNRKLLPLPWVKLDDEIPAGFATDVSLTESNRPGYGFLSKAAALLWYTGVRWHHRLYCNKRGYYPLGPIRISSGDIFGFYPREVTVPLIDYVTVYPRIFPIAQLGIPSLHPLGETTAERRLFEDPSRTIGVRDYSYHDSLKHVHWKATARHQALKVKVFEPTTTLKVTLFLAVDSFHHDDEAFDEDNFELGVSTTASIANYMAEQHCSIGLSVNSRLADSGQSARLPPGSGAGQLVRILETLARVTPSPSDPFEDFLQCERRGLPWGTSLVVILDRPSQPLEKLLISLKESGYKLMVLQVGLPEERKFEHSIIWHKVRQPDDFMKINSKED